MWRTDPLPSLSRATRLMVPTSTEGRPRMDGSTSSPNRVYTEDKIPIPGIVSGLSDPFWADRVFSIILVNTKAQFSSISLASIYGTPTQLITSIWFRSWLRMLKNFICQSLTFTLAIQVIKEVLGHYGNPPKSTKSLFLREKSSRLLTVLFLVESKTSSGWMNTVRFWGFLQS